MRTRTMLLATAAAGLSAAAGFAALSQAGGEGSVTPGPSVVSRPLAARTANNAAPIPRLAATLPSFARTRSSLDFVGRNSAGTPREAILFGTRGDLDTGASRRVYAAEGRAIFAAPSRDRSKVCFALTEDRPDGVWALNFCGSSASLRGRPLIWNVNTVRAPAGRLLVAWGIASHTVTRITANAAAGAASATPNGDGLFVIDLSELGAPTQILAEDARGRIVDRDIVPAGAFG